MASLLLYKLLYKCKYKGKEMLGYIMPSNASESISRMSDTKVTDVSVAEDRNYGD